MGTTEVHGKLVVNEHPNVIVTTERELHTCTVGEVRMGFKAEHLVVMPLDTQIPRGVVVNVGMLTVTKFTRGHRIKVNIGQTGNRLNGGPVHYIRKGCLSDRRDIVRGSILGSSVSQLAFPKTIGNVA